MRRYVACLKFLPALLFVSWQASFVCIGIFTMVTDHSIQMQTTCKGSSLFKYLSFNTVFAGMVLFTFLSWPGGGEGARARATLCMLIHFGLSVWGLLLWTHHSCWTLLQAQYKTALAFHHMCVVTNALLFVFYTLHEVYIGRIVGADLTLMPRIMRDPEKPSPEYVPALGGQFVPPGHVPPSVDQMQVPSVGPVSPLPIGPISEHMLPHISAHAPDPVLAAVLSEPGDQGQASVQPPVVSLP